MALPRCPPVLLSHRKLGRHHRNGSLVRGEDGFLRGAIIGRNIRNPASLLVKLLPTRGRSLFTSQRTATTPGRLRVNLFHCPCPQRRKRVIPRFSCVSAFGQPPCSLASSSRSIARSNESRAGGSRASATAPISQFSICSKVREELGKEAPKPWYGRQDRTSWPSRTPVVLIKTWQTLPDSSLKTQS